ncbi:MAG TPA: hypothetical protein PK597_01245 [Oscillospiraceae bacterium]|nr:hypothetical protein [Oscillospiraceae bacterium]
MTLLELSAEYDRQARLLRARIHLLRYETPPPEDERERALLSDRLRMLDAMARQARELAELTAHYYERGYRKNEKYTL